MAYIKNSWKSGDVITATKLNHMEDGIAEGGSGGDQQVTLDIIAIQETDAETGDHNYIISSASKTPAEVQDLILNGTESILCKLEIRACESETVYNSLILSTYMQIQKMINGSSSSALMVAIEFLYGNNGTLGLMFIVAPYDATNWQIREINPQISQGSQPSTN